VYFNFKIFTVDMTGMWYTYVQTLTVSGYYYNSFEIIRFKGQP